MIANCEAEGDSKGSATLLANSLSLGLFCGVVLAAAIHIFSPVFLASFTGAFCGVFLAAAIHIFSLAFLASFIGSPHQ
ncbi:hypothetical protein T484DRAFT_1823850 [Baffinella frigidus]|nr:hypothetical protein T484DRAFT_1823850 [Cryptophyta sp. CCMP2293]